jgi:hypothetical protein
MAVPFPVVAFADAAKICNEAHFPNGNGQKERYAEAVADALFELSSSSKQKADEVADQYTLYKPMLIKRLHTLDQALVKLRSEWQTRSYFAAWVGRALFASESVDLSANALLQNQNSLHTNEEWIQLFHNLPISEESKSVITKLWDAICAFFSYLLALITCKQEGAKS